MDAALVPYAGPPTSQAQTTHLLVLGRLYSDSIRQVSHREVPSASTTYDLWTYTSSTPDPSPVSTTDPLRGPQDRGPGPYKESDPTVCPVKWVTRESVLRTPKVRKTPEYVYNVWTFFKTKVLSVAFDGLILRV